MSDFSDESLLQEFVAESQEHLSSIEPDLLMLEKEGENVDSEVVNRIFRAMHSIKGAAGFFGLNNLKNTSHIMESVLMQIRDGECSPTPTNVDALLLGVDKLNIMINDVSTSETVDCAADIKRLEAILNQGDESTSEGAVTGSDNVVINPKFELPKPLPFNAERDDVISSLSEGLTLFAIGADEETDINTLTKLLKEKGRILDTQKVESAEINLNFILFATTLTYQQIAENFELEEKQIITLDFMEVLEKEASEAESKPAPPSSTLVAPENKTEDDKENGKKELHNTHEAANETVRVKVHLLNKLMNLAGEMVLLRNQLNRNLVEHTDTVEGLAAIMQNLDLTTTDLQEHIMQTRMQPIGNIFGKFPRVVRDLSKHLGKEIELQITGNDVELDKSLIESLSDPLTHLIRNCCDHAVEMPNDREVKGKQPKGTINLDAYHEGGQINIAITDDGKGIDGSSVAQKAIDNGSITKAEVDKMGWSEKINLIFLPGLSTAKEVSDVSGRGVGMDVVRNNIEKLGGQITLESEPDKGTKIILKLPLTLAIIPSLLVQTQEFRFAIPQVNLVELISVKNSDVSEKIERVGGATVLRLRGKLLPLLKLSQVLNLSDEFVNPVSGDLKEERRKSLVDERKIVKTGVTDENGDLITHKLESFLELDQEDSTEETVPENRREDNTDDMNIVVLKVGTHEYGLIVDMVLDLEEIVVKPLSSYLKACRCFSGSTIMGDGRVAMILDSTGIATQAKLSFTQKTLEEKAKQEKETVEELVEKREIILFNNNPDEIFAVPLNSILRLEKFNLADIQNIGGREFITYQGKGLPLIRLESYLPVKPSMIEGEQAYLIIPRAGQLEAGIVASNIIDTLNASIHMQNTFGEPQLGTEGSAIIDERLTIFIDPEGLMTAAGIQYQKESSPLQPVLAEAV